jgi:hypothetical protein
MSRNDHLNHRPDEAGIAKIAELRRAIINLDSLIDQLVPNSREKSLAQTKLEECRMWAVKGIVLQYPADEIDPPVGESAEPAQEEASTSQADTAATPAETAEAPGAAEGEPQGAACTPAPSATTQADSTGAYAQDAEAPASAEGESQALDSTEE